jgi:hypothetical protein
MNSGRGSPSTLEVDGGVWKMKVEDGRPGRRLRMEVDSRRAAHEVTNYGVACLPVDQNTSIYAYRPF